MNKDDKLKALDAALTQIEKAYGKGSVMKLGDSGANMNIETVPTGSLSLDIALGLGGLPKGRVVEIYGPESSGKTTVALHMVAEVQKRGGIAGFIDAEQVADAYTLETDVEKVYVYFPVEKLDTKEVKEAQLVKQYQYKGETCYDNIISKVTDDGKYIHGIVYTRDETEIKISVFIDQ